MTFDVIFRHGCLIYSPGTPPSLLRMSFLRFGSYVCVQLLGPNLRSDYFGSYIILEPVDVDVYF